MNDAASIRRQLKIKSGVTKRLTKENGLYRKEAEALQRKQNKLVADGAEEWDIKNAGKMFDESTKLIADTGNRLEGAVAELEALVIAAKKIPEMAGNPELVTAEEALRAASL